MSGGGVYSGFDRVVNSLCRKVAEELVSLPLFRE